MCVCAWDKDKNMWGQLRAEKRPGGKKRKKKKDYKGRRSKFEAAEQRTLLNTHKKIRELKYIEGMEAA